MENIHQYSNKPEWRKRMAVVRDGLSVAERAKRSVQICELLETVVFSEMRRKLARPLSLCAYAPFRSEASPVPLMETCWSMGDSIYAPRIRTAGEGMELRRVTGMSDWAPGRWGVPEPDPQRAELMEEANPIDVVLVPGMAYSLSGGKIARLGYGGGYYDRLYSERSRVTDKRTLWIGFAYALQVVAEPLPIEPHDLPLDGLATDEDLIWSDRGERSWNEPETG
ncbi:5-formyltetrahydrofolate cyclo-ligase [Cohnella terricola]|nr:5-formyltetrahydrofolate cyclo-ligase [Cohnella terricola]